MKTAVMKDFGRCVAVPIVTTFALAASLYLAGCSTNSAPSQPAEADTAMHTTDVPTYFDTDAEPQQVTLTFFDDMPSVPYIRIDDFYQTFLHGKMDVVAGDNGTFTLRVEDGTTATVDAGADSFSADDFTAFVSQPLLKGNGASTLATSLAPFLALEEETTERAASPVSIDFAHFGIDLRAKDGALYLPLATANDIFETSKSFRVSWDGSTIYAYILDPNNTYRRTEPIADEEAYLKGLTATSERPADMIDFAYKELCYKIDTFYGFPGSAPLNDAVASLGLDEALKQNDPQTRELLLSADKVSYVWGLNRLLGYDLDDKSHTDFSDYMFFVMDPDDAFAASVLELEPEYGMETAPASVAFKQASRGSRAAKQEAFGEDAQFGNFYTEAGDTALFSFQTFKTNSDGWEAYYAG